MTGNRNPYSKFAAKAYATNHQKPRTPWLITPGSRAGLEPRSGGKSVAVQPIVKSFSVRYPEQEQHPVQEQPYGCY
jgi:hypothetical protein